jgi:hypothetical protein
MPPPFKTTSELLAYAQDNPHTLRSRWYDYYVARNVDWQCRIVEPLKLNCIKWQSDVNLASGFLSSELLTAAYTPIPCPHFIFRYTTDWLPLLSGLKLPSNEYHAACNIAAAQRKHSLTLCVQDAWKMDDSIFMDRLAEWLNEDICNALIDTGEELSIDMSILDTYIAILIDNVFTPAIAYQKEVFLAGHRERGLLNKELFNK